MEQRTAQTATVDVLTAEVRVLMIGSRQVTMSVYKQLDWIAPDKIVPFGRINDGERWVSSDVERLVVVGQNPDDGSLVRARFRRQHRGTVVRTGEKLIKYSDSADASMRLCTRSEWEAAEALPLIVLAGLR